MHKGKLIVISASSGVGKTTLVNQLCLQRPHIKRAITFTTRPARSGEIPGVDYHFISEPDFLARISQGFFLEWSHEYGYYYGSPAYLKDDLDKGISYAIILDRKGAQAIKGHMPEAVLIWLYLEDSLELRQRLEGRNTESPGSLEKRLSLARQAIEAEQSCPIFTHHICHGQVQDTIDLIIALLGEQK